MQGEAIFYEPPEATWESSSSSSSLGVDGLATDTVAAPLMVADPLAPAGAWHPRQHSSDAPHHHRLSQRHRSLGVFGCSSCCRFCSSSCFCSCYPCCESAAAKNSRQKSRSRKQKGPAVARAAVTPARPLPSEAPAPQGYLAYSV